MTESGIAASGFALTTQGCALDIPKHRAASVSERSRVEAAQHGRIRVRPNTTGARVCGENRTEPCPSGSGPFPWLFSPAEPTDSSKITKQSQFTCKTNYFNNLDDI